MTEKRFIIAESKGTQWIEEMTLNAEPITNIAQAVKKLNDLSKENEQLKQKIISLEDARYSYKQDWKQASSDCELYKDEIKFLKDENKGLIEENEKLKQQVQNIHKLINSKIQSARELGNLRTVIALKDLQRELKGDVE